MAYSGWAASQMPAYADLGAKERTSKRRVVAPRIGPVPRILIVDDDQIFCRIIQKIADQQGLDVVTCQTLSDVLSLDDWAFDAIIVDFALMEISGPELVRSLEKRGLRIPAILISRNQRTPEPDWPVSLRDFVHKALGPYAILDATMEAIELDRASHSSNNTRLSLVKSKPVKAK